MADTREGLVRRSELSKPRPVDREILMQDCVEFLFCQRSDIEVKIPITVSNILPKIHFSGVDGAVEYTVLVVNHKFPSVVGLKDGEQIHVLNIGRHHHPAALADRSHQSDPYLLAHFRTDDGLGMVLILRSIMIGDVGMESMSEELLDHRDGTVASVGRIPHVGSSFRIALACFVGEIICREVGSRSVHHDGVGGRLIRASLQPGQTLLEGDPLWDGKGPVDGVQLGMPIDAAVVPDICPRKRTRVSSNVPFALFLQKLESGQPLFPLEPGVARTLHCRAGMLLYSWTSVGSEQSYGVR